MAPWLQNGAWVAGRYEEFHKPTRHGPGRVNTNQPLKMRINMHIVNAYIATYVQISFSRHQSACHLPTAAASAGWHTSVLSCVS
jgi:hypothetical protein